MFLITVLFLNAAKTKQELDSAVFQTAGIAQKFNCTLNRLDYMQEQGLMSSLPLANNLVPNQAGIDYNFHRHLRAVHHTGTFHGIDKFQQRGEVLLLHRYFMIHF